MAPLRLAWVSPLPPVPSGVADYAASMAPLLSRRADVLVFGTRRRQRVPGMRPGRVEEFVRSARSFDAAFYHLGNNLHHAPVYRAAREHPGVVVLHDLVLHHFLNTFAHSEQRKWMYVDPLLSEYGDLGARLLDLADRHLSTRAQLFLFPLIGHVAATSRGVVVHTAAGRRLVEADAPGVPVAVIPHFAPPVPAAIRAVSRSEARSRLGLPADAFLVGHFGFLTPAKQPSELLGGFAELVGRVPDARLLLVGADEAGPATSRTADRLGIRDAIFATGYVELERFHLYLRAVDAVVSLRHPSAGEMSGALVRALAEGRPVVASDHASLAELPDEAVLRVAVDEPQAPAVAELLLRLAGDPDLRRAAGEAARRHAETHLDAAACRDRYVAFAERVAS